MSKIRSNPFFPSEVGALSNALGVYWRELATALNTSSSTTSTTGTGSTTGSTEVDFGTAATDATKTVTGQTGITASSILKAWVYPKATTNNTLDNHWVEDMSVYAGNISGTSFTIYAKANHGKCHGKFTVNWEWV